MIKFVFFFSKKSATNFPVMQIAAHVREGKVKRMYMNQVSVLRVKLILKR